MIRSILVPLDGSKFGEHALTLALSIARRAGADLQLVHVYVPVAPAFIEGFVAYDKAWDARLFQQSRAYLDTVAGRVAAVSGLKPQTVLLEGQVVDAILERARSTPTDLVVMTTHGRGGLARAWLGSVADELVRRLTTPLLFVRPQDQPADLRNEPVLRQVLIPLDGSELGESILEPAVTLGTLMDADYRLLRIVKPMVLGNYVPLEPGLGGAVDSELVKELAAFHEEEKQHAQAYLDTVAGRLRGRSLRVRTDLAIAEPPAAEILHQAQTQATDLIALATHGRSGLTRLFLGSVADKVLRGVHVPVLVQRSAEK